MGGSVYRFLQIVLITTFAGHLFHAATFTVTFLLVREIFLPRSRTRLMHRTRSVSPFHVPPGDARFDFEILQLIRHVGSERI